MRMADLTCWMCKSSGMVRVLRLHGTRRFQSRISVIEGVERMVQRNRCVSRQSFRIASVAFFWLCTHVLYAQELPDAEGKELVSAVCTQCHNLRSTMMLRNGQEGWRRVVERMVIHGAQIFPDEVDIVV